MSQKETDCREEELPEPVIPVTAQPEEQLERITVKRGNAIEVLTLDEILYFQADGDAHQCEGICTFRIMKDALHLMIPEHIRSI